jgi:cell division septation protein DedD
VSAARREERRRERRLGWLRLAAKGVVWGTLGFAVGGLAGVAVEEPRLVLAFLSGETESVDLAGLEGEPAPPPVRVAAPTPLGAREPAPAAPSPALPAVSAPARGPRFVIQVGAFAERHVADRLRARLADAGFPAFVETGEASPGSSWRVRVGPIAGQDEAQRLASRLKTEQRLPTWVQPLPR